MKKISTIRLIIPQILMTAVCIVYLYISKVVFYTKVKSIAYGIDSIKADSFTGKVTKDPNVELGLKLFVRYQYFNYTVMILFILICFLRYALILNRSKKVFNKKSYVLFSFICTTVIGLFNIVLWGGDVRMKKNLSILSLFVQIIINSFNIIATKIETDSILNYYSNIEKYNKFIINRGNYSWYDLMSYEKRVDFRNI